jgi:hypothetical protein
MPYSVAPCVGTDAPGFYDHVLARKKYSQLNLIQQWAATKLGWKKETWDTQSFVPFSLMREITLTLTLTLQPHA